MILPALVFVFAAVDFSKDAAALLERSCIRCHSAGNVNLSSRQAMLASQVLVPGQPEASTLYTSITKGTMPPDGRIAAAQVEVLRAWIAQGAPWPAGVTLSKSSQTPAVVPAAGSLPNNAEMANVARIRERILSTRNPPAGKPQPITIPNTTITYTVVPIPAGDFEMGSPDGPIYSKDEQPRHKVHVDAFAMQTHEVTWDEYRLFMFANQAGETAHKDEVVDAVSRPTRPYVEMSFGMGINGYPAISMTQHAANKYAEWLSSKTGEFYRLPTEAEWEYACRAGTETAYFFGDNQAQLGDHAWFAANSGGKYGKVASKKPNAWGLYDMLGNVMEWTLDGYAPYQPGMQSNPWVKATSPYPQVARGGSWNDPPERVRCGSRVPSDPSWKQQDPQLPKSIWYLTDAQWLGFRLVRPAKVPSTEEMYRYWNSGVEHDER